MLTVKLLAAFGAWMGPWNVVQTALAAGVIGGVLAIGLALSRNYMSQAFVNMWSLLAFWRNVGSPTASDIDAGQSRGAEVGLCDSDQLGSGRRSVAAVTVVCEESPFLKSPRLRSTA